MHRNQWCLCRQWRQWKWCWRRTYVKMTIILIPYSREDKNLRNETMRCQQRTYVRMTSYVKTAMTSMPYLREDDILRKDGDAVNAILTLGWHLTYRRRWCQCRTYVRMTSYVKTTMTSMPYLREDDILRKDDDDVSAVLTWTWGWQLT